MTETTATFRVYSSYAGHLYLSVDTSETDVASIAVWEGDDGTPAVAELDADTARTFATTMVAYNGSHACWTVEPVVFGDIEMTIEDGQVFLSLLDVPPFDLGEGDCDPFVQDLAQRLIVWAGVDLRVATDA